jgi:hypothetical protein
MDARWTRDVAVMLRDLHLVGGGRRCSAMNANTSADVTSTGARSTTLKNARRSDRVAITVFGLHRAPPPGEN